MQAECGKMSRKADVYTKLVLIAALLFLVLPSGMRAMEGNVYLIGGESYYHARIAEQIAEGNFPDADSGIASGRDYVFSPYHLLLAVFALFFGAFAASKIVPLLLGLLCVYLFYLVLSRLGVGVWVRLVMLCLFVLSPVFIYVFNVSGPSCFILTLSLAGLFFLMRPGWLNTAFSLVFFSIVAMFGVAYAVVSVFIVFFYAFKFKKKARRGYVVIAAVVFVMLSYSLPWYIASEKADFVAKSLVVSFFSDLGGVSGLSVFAFLLALAGCGLVWRYKKQYYLFYVFSILLVVCSFFNNDLLIYSNLVVVFFAGIAFVHFSRMHWSLRVLRDFTLIVLFCGLLFSAFTAVFALQNSLPNSPLVNSLVWLNLNSGEGDVVFSHYSNGFWIETVSKRPVVMDGLFHQTRDAGALYFDSIQLFEANDLGKARSLLSKYNVKYIVITENMYDGLVWRSKDEGLGFLLSNAETFKKVQENSFVVIYEYVYMEG